GLQERPDRGDVVAREHLDRGGQRPAGSDPQREQATIWVMSIRRASSEDATSPYSQPVSHTFGSGWEVSSRTTSLVRARCAMPAACAIPSCSHTLARTSSVMSSGAPSRGRKRVV